MKSTKFSEALTAFCQRIAPYFHRSETRQQAFNYLKSLAFSPCQRNSWTLAQSAGDAGPQKMQRLLRTAIWDDTGILHLLQADIFKHLQAAEDCLILDDTGFEKAGTHSVGVQRQYTGTAGKVTNCQVAVFLAYSSPKGAALLDFRLYLPRAWTQDADRLRRAGLSDDTPFRTKGQLATAQLEAAYAAGLSAAWVVTDAGYSDCAPFRALLLQRAQAHVLGVQLSHEFTPEVPPDTRLWGRKRKHGPAKIEREGTLLVEDAPQLVETWSRVRLRGSKGWRKDQWALLPMLYRGARAHLLLRKTASKLSAYLVWSPQPVTVGEAARAASRRWDIESCFEEAKQEGGLDEFQVRGFQAWRRHLVLCLVCMWLLIQQKGLGSVPLARRMAQLQLCQTQADEDQAWHWIQFRLRHNAKAQQSHWRSNAWQEDP